MKILDVWVPGRPTTKGSVKHIGQGRVRQSVKGSTEWAGVIRRAVAGQVARGLAGFAPRDVPVQVRVTYRMPGTDPVAERIGDVDKLVRNVLDALTRNEKIRYPGVYVDDVQVIGVDSARFAGGPSGCHIVVSALAPEMVRSLADRAEINAWFAYRAATDPSFRHAEGATLGHDCVDSGCGM